MSQCPWQCLNDNSICERTEELHQTPYMTGFVKKGFGEMVEVAGIEPASESISTEATTCLSSALLDSSSLFAVNNSLMQDLRPASSGLSG